MTNFGDQIREFNRGFQATSQAHFVNVVSALAASITDGSPVTGSPGQPVDTGNLKASWHTDFTSPRQAMISTNVEYAPYIEDGIVPLGGRRGNATGSSSQRLTLRSQVGGFHSVALTIAGFDRVIENEMLNLVTPVSDPVWGGPA